jgi:hypothetical protein
MGAHETFAVIVYEGKNIGLLLVSQFQFPDAVEENCVEIVRVQVMVAGDGTLLGELDRVFRGA